MNTWMEEYLYFYIINIIYAIDSDEVESWRYLGPRYSSEVEMRFINVIVWEPYYNLTLNYVLTLIDFVYLNNVFNVKMGIKGNKVD